jgi:hypothetical protein
LLLVLLAIGALVEPTSLVHAQATTAHLTMTVTGQSLTAGFNNTVTITLLNNYTSAIYTVDITVTLPSTLTLIGDNHWHYDSLNLGQSVVIRFGVYAPTSAIGSTYLGSVAATYKQLGDVSNTSESHALSFSVYGYINLLIYGIQLSPSSVAPGGNATISGNLLNSGNLAAYNTNVTARSEALAATSTSSAFVGEVDPNIPRPFSMLLVFKSNIPVGNYSITVRVSAIDNNRPGVPIVNQKDAQIQIRRATQQPGTTRQQGRGIVEMIIQILRYLYDMFVGSLTGILAPLQWSAATQPYRLEPSSLRS